MYRRNLLTGVTRDVFRFINENRRTYAVFCGLAICVFTAFDFFSFEGEQAQLLSARGEIFNAALMAISTALVAVPIHIFIIEDRFSLFPKSFQQTLLFAILEFLLSFLLLIMAFGTVGAFNLVSRIFPDGLYWLSVVLVGAVGFGLFFLAIGFGVVLTTVLPHVAVTPMSNFDIRFPIQLSQGFRISIFVRLFRLAFLLGVVTGGFALLFGSTFLNPASSESTFGYYVQLFFWNSLYSINSLLFVTLASLIYLRLIDRRSTVARPD